MTRAARRIERAGSVPRAGWRRWNESGRKLTGESDEASVRRTTLVLRSGGTERSSGTEILEGLEAAEVLFGENLPSGERALLNDLSWR